jgi:catechol 2,3-dioxygenase-like lactoylglutathione lyase family enzyme
MTFTNEFDVWPACDNVSSLKHVNLKMAKLEFLDHVAIRVQDPERSARWYGEVLGLERFQPEEWKPVPIMMLAGRSGIALFSDPEKTVSPEMKEVMHIAFRVGPDKLGAIKQQLEEHGVDYFEENHVHFLSVYFRDPDNFRLEITMPIAQ